MCQADPGKRLERCAKKHIMFFRGSNKKSKLCFFADQTEKKHMVVILLCAHARYLSFFLWEISDFVDENLKLHRVCYVNTWTIPRYYELRENVYPRRKMNVQNRVD